MALHEQSVGRSDEWYTPPYVFDALGCEFWMDVASPGKHIVPWIPAKIHYTNQMLPWADFVWMNPPFGGRNAIAKWLDKFFKHGNGIALTPDRTSAPWWAKFAPKADAILFVSPKIKFISGEGATNRNPAQGTSLMACGAQGVEALAQAARNGLGVLVSPLQPRVPQTGDLSPCDDDNPDTTCGRCNCWKATRANCS